MYVKCEIRETVLPPRYDFTFEQNNVVGAIIGPKQDVAGGLVPAPPDAVTPQQIIDAQEGRKFIYLWGWVRYFDVFPDTPQHLTHFCWFISTTGDPRTFVPGAPGQPPAPGTMGFGWIQHREGNYTEETYDADLSKPK